jgi:hypothetical protein
MNTIHENNKLIATFLGYTFYPWSKKEVSKAIDINGWRKERYNPFKHGKFRSGINSVHLAYRHDDLEFHTSWDWLMPVVEKIESLGFGVNILVSNTISIINMGWEQNIKLPYKILNTYPHDSKFEAVYKAVIEFIKWYNQNK